MARLPIPAGDDNQWGVILNDFLVQAHNDDGTIKDVGVVAQKYTKPGSGIPKSDLSAAVQASLDSADDAPALSDSAAVALGTAAAGAATTASRSDHVHPTTGLTLATGGGLEGVVTNATASGAVSLDLAGGNVFNITLVGNTTFSFTGATNGRACAFGLYLAQDGTGGRTVTWPGSVLWPDGTEPTLTTALGSIDVLVFETINGGTTWFGALAGANYS